MIMHAAAAGFWNVRPYGTPESSILAHSLMFASIPVFYMVFYGRFIVKFLVASLISNGLSTFRSCWSYLVFLTCLVGYVLYSLI